MTGTDAFDSLERYCRERDYAGHSKFDALNSPFLTACFGFSAPTRLVVTQLVNRSPIPLRGLLGVRKGRNPKGIANFIRAYCAAHEVTGAAEHLDRARALADWLLAHESSRVSDFRGKGLGWGYNFPWQSPGLYAERFHPNCIVTVFAGEAFLHLYQRTGDRAYLEAARGAARFVLEDLPVLESSPGSLCIGYVPLRLKWRVVNINAVAAGFLAKLAAPAGEPALAETAGRMIQWVIDARHENDSWSYTSPASQSGIGPDNYHTGGILDGIHDYMTATGDTQPAPVFDRALAFYADRFFLPDGAPKWRVNRDYPHDIHGAAQGILTFSRTRDRFPRAADLAERVLQWTLARLRDPSGRFYYQKTRFFTRKLELMRWNNSWMALALAEHRLAVTRAQTTPQRRAA